MKHIPTLINRITVGPIICLEISLSGHTHTFAPLSKSLRTLFRRGLAFRSKHFVSREIVKKINYFYTVAGDCPSPMLKTHFSVSTQKHSASFA